MPSAVQATRETIDQLMLLIIAIGGLIALTLVITHLTIGTYRALFPTGRAPRSRRRVRRVRSARSTCNSRSTGTTRRPSPRNIVVGPAASGPSHPSPTHHQHEPEDRESRAADDRAASGRLRLVGVALHALRAALLRDPLAANGKPYERADDEGQVGRRRAVLEHAGEHAQRRNGDVTRTRTGARRSRAVLPTRFRGGWPGGGV
ncbi:MULTISPECIES: hypothetical protein [unclassified Nonomuraea]|uniref:hypothetical protein n=1 Tax=unclassified Nonomuraea TaxID=2593643 RepID=UPI0033E2B52A